MKKLILLIILLILGAVLLLGSGGTEAATKKKVTKPKTKKVVTTLTAENPNINSNVVFYIPHQDDESLNFGVGIMNHLWGGHNVHVVLLTDGSAAGVRTSMGMTEAEFTKARNKEFAHSLAIMGVKAENITYKGFKDGQLTTANVEGVIKEYETKYPNAKHKAYSYTDWHNDHKVTGLALKSMVDKGIVTDARYYIRRGDNPTGVNIINEPFQEAYRPLLLAVSSVYSIEVPRIGYYGIGLKSASSGSFPTFETQPSSRYHK